MELKDSQTKTNLMRAFAGESQARNRYTFAYEKAKELKFEVLAEVFKMTADQEKEHAKIFYTHLKALTGQSLEIDGGYPVDHYEDMQGLLDAAKEHEKDEAEDIYPAFAKTAQAEGFLKVAADFEAIAKIEKIHSARFERFAALLLDHDLFSSAKPVQWLCLNCGHVHEGPEAPKACPVCHQDQGYFVRLELAPYTCLKMVE